MRGECPGVIAGVWPGVGDIESVEKVGDGGFVEKGDPGLDLFANRCPYWSSSSCECVLDIGWDEGCEDGCEDGCEEG